MTVAIFTTRFDEFSDEAKRLGVPVYSVLSPGEGMKIPRVALFRLWYQSDFTDPDRLSAIRGLETILRASGAVVVNPWCAHDLAWKKDLYYRVIPAPPFLVNPTTRQVRDALDAGAIRLPFVVRPGRDRDRSLMRLVKSVREFEEAAGKITGPVLVVRFIPDSQGDLHARYRVFVLGPRVDMAFRMLGSDWRVHGVINPEHRKVDSETPEGDTGPIRQRFVESNQDRAGPRVGWAAVVGANSLGLQVASVDVLTDPESGLNYVVDVNAGYSYLPVPEYFPNSRRAERLGHVKRVVAYLEGLAS